MISPLARIDLKEALGQEGCPICRLKRKAEERYLNHLLWEYVNDLTARAKFLASWGYCGRHAFMLGRFEMRSYQDGTGTASMYEGLLQQFQHRLKKILEEIPRGLARKPGPIRRFLGIKPRPFSSPLKSGAACEICRVAQEAEAWALEDFLSGLKEKESAFLDLYRSSDGLCFLHLRGALTQIDSDGFELAETLVRHSQQQLARLQSQIEGYIRKHSWQFRDEPLTDEERASWKKAIAFFAGSPIGEPWEILEEPKKQPGEEAESFRETRKPKEDGR